MGEPSQGEKEKGLFSQIPWDRSKFTSQRLNVTLCSGARKQAVIDPMMAANKNNKKQNRDIIAHSIHDIDHHAKYVVE